jgi:peroxiredoxin
MKKILLVLAASAFVVSCNNLADNEFQIEGKVDPSLNGKSVYLEKTGGYTGYIPVDTVKIEDGKFIFKDTVSEPSFHFISIEGKPMDKLNIVLEPGKLEIEVDKDTMFKSKLSGTYNNEKLYSYSVDAIKIRKGQQKKDAAFREKYKEEIASAMVSKDTVVFNRLNKLYMAENKGATDASLKFVKENPKAFISIYILRDLISKRAVTVEEGKKMFTALDADVKKTKVGKELEAMIKEIETPAATAQPTTDNAGASVGKPAPAFTAPGPDGKAVSLQSALGKVTVVDFWASWCKPCRVENPNVVAMYNELHSKGLNIIGVSLDKDAAKWKEAIAADKLTWSHVSNLKFWEEPIAAQYGVKSIPATFILDAKGNIVAKDLRGDALKAKVEELLKA